MDLASVMLIVTLSFAGGFILGFVTGTIKNPEVSA